MDSPQVPAVGESGTPRRRLPSLPGLSLRLPSDVAKIVLMWAAWLAIVCAFQIVVQARLQPARPDAVLAWTPNETSYVLPPAAGPGCRPHLADENMNEHVSFDSEYYISIASTGYDDPNTPAYVSMDGHVIAAGVPECTPGMDGWTSLDYAFMPGYPMAMRPVMAIEGVLPFTSDLTQDGRATLAGIIVSALGGLLAMLALARMMAYLGRRRSNSSSGKAARALPWFMNEMTVGAVAGVVTGVVAFFLTGSNINFAVLGVAAGWLVADLLFVDWRGGSDSTDEQSSWGGIHGLRGAFYLLIFPTGFYLAQVYTEGLFIGLAFMACALAVEKKVLGAAIFAALAAVTRQAGFLLFLPIAWATLQILRDGQTRPKGWRIAIPVLAPLAPLAAFAAWFFSPLGRNWEVVEKEYFSRSFDIPKSIDVWLKAWDSLVSGVDKSLTPGVPGYAVYGGGPLQTSTSVYIALEFIALALGIVACIWLLRRMPGVALFGLGVIVLSAGSSGAQGMDRYVLAVPAIILMLAWYGRREVFDRAWVLASTLLMGMLVMLYTFGFWVS